MRTFWYWKCSRT